MSKSIVLNAITIEQVEQCTEKLSVKVSNTRKQVVYQTIINSNHVLKWFEDEDNVYYYKIGGQLKHIGVANSYEQYIALILQRKGNKKPCIDFIDTCIDNIYNNQYLNTVNSLSP